MLEISPHVVSYVNLYIKQIWMDGWTDDWLTDWMNEWMNEITPPRENLNTGTNPYSWPFPTKGVTSEVDSRGMIAAHPDVCILRPHSIIIVSCKPGCKSGFRPSLQPGFRQVCACLRHAFDMLSTRFRLFCRKPGCAHAASISTCGRY